MALDMAPRLDSVCVTCRKVLDKLIDLIFGLCCNRKRTRIPDLEEKHRILLNNAVSLADKIRNKQLKSEDLVRACIERIKQVNPILNAVTDERFEAALQDARAVDELIKKKGGEASKLAENKPFLGVPFTAKESMAVAGMLHTLGIKSRKNIRATEDAECVRLLKEAGAIPVAVTNVPEICKWIETRNMLFGQTRNPHHTGRTTGGSSGGEAALAAAIATPISLCGDTGGSTRMPAFYCGLYAFTPTAGHTSNRGSTLSDGKSPTMGSISFLSRHCSDLIPLTKIVAAEKAVDLDLDRVVDVKAIKYYYVESAQDLRVSPICDELKNAMKRVVNFLTQELPPGCAPMPYSHVGFNHMFKLWRHRMTYEAIDFPLMLNNNERPAKFFVELGKKLICLSDFTLAAILGLADKQILPQVKKEWAEDILTELKENLIDLLGTDGVLLFPSAPYPAPYHYTSLFRPFNFAYWAIFNALQFPAVQIPLGLTARGLPQGIQVAAAPRCDALCVAVAQYVGHAHGGVRAPCKIADKESKQNLSQMAEARGGKIRICCCSSTSIRRLLQVS